MSFESLKNDLKNPEAAVNELKSSSFRFYEFGDFRLDSTKRVLLREGATVPLTPKCFDVLLLLVSRRGQIVSKDELMTRVWPDTIVEENNLNVNVSLLRKTLGEKPNDHRFIVTVPGSGYQFVAEVRLIDGENNGAAERRSGLTTSSVSRPRQIGVMSLIADTPGESYSNGPVEVAQPTRSTAYDIPDEKSSRRLATALLPLAVLLTVAVAVYLWYSPRRDTRTINSVAVLPLTNATKDPNAEYLSDAISGNLINSLSQLPQLKVIAQASSFKYKGKEIDPQELANAMGVQAIVTGSIVRFDDNLQISVELIDARDKTQMWGEHYKRKVADLQVVQEEIARTISEKLRIRLTGAQARQLTKRATENDEAYRLYLNGIFYQRRGGIENFNKAINCFEDAIALDPNFALAYVGFAMTNNLLLGCCGLNPDITIPKVRAAVEKALELDESLADAHASLAVIKRQQWDWIGAEMEFKRAIELNPNLAWAHGAYGVSLARMGRFEEALTENKRALELDPLSMLFKEIEVGNLRFARRYDESLQSMQALIKTHPEYVGRSQRAYTYAAKGMYAEAIADYQENIKVDGENTSDEIYLGYAYAMLGKRDRALAILKKLKTTTDYVSPAELAILYIGLGDKDRAFQSLERAYTSHDFQMQFLKVDSHYDAIRSDRRFIDLMRRVGLPVS
jgi:DNA-binding winged helix-turn-helix (wHTH) protein/TolB-like protein/Flp pilus assembly protein TadD